MYIGEYQHNLDSKGRLIIPSKFREGLQENFYLSLGLDECITIYSVEQWNKIEAKLSTLPQTKAAARTYIRRIFARTYEVSLDSQGRVQIPSPLLKDTSIVKECSIIGVNDHIEIWDTAKWNNYFESGAQNFEEIAEELTEFL